MVDPKKQERIYLVKALLADFSKQHLASAPDVVGYIEKLWDEIGNEAKLRHHRRYQGGVGVGRRVCDCAFELSL